MFHYYFLGSFKTLPLLFNLHSLDSCMWFEVEVSFFKLISNWSNTIYCIYYSIPTAFQASFVIICMGLFLDLLCCSTRLLIYPCDNSTKWFFFFLKNGLAILNPLHFHVNFLYIYASVTWVEITLIIFYHCIWLLFLSVVLACIWKSYISLELFLGI